MLEQWQGLLQFFEPRPSKSLARTKSVLKEMKKPETKAYLLFLAAVLPVVNGYNRAFQRNKVEVHRLHDEQTRLVRRVVLSFLKPEAVLDVPVEDLEFDQPHQFLNDEDVFIGALTKDYLDSLPPEVELDKVPSLHLAE